MIFKHWYEHKLQPMFTNIPFLLFQFHITCEKGDKPDWLNVKTYA